MILSNGNGWLLCDFHIHTTMSDGTVDLRDVVDMYGEAGVDVIAITDHILDADTIAKRKEQGEPLKAIEKEEFHDYLCELWREAERAWSKYNMILIPGVEITNNTKLYHIVAVDIKDYVDPTLPVEEILERLRMQRAVSIAAHPDRKKTDKEHLSWYLWANKDKYRCMFDAWEVANRDDLFNSIGVKKFNYVANSDFHEPRHLYSWKTLIRAEKNVEAIKEAIRRNENVAIYLFRERGGS